MRNEHLKTEIKDGMLVISIGIDTLCHAVSIGRRYGIGEISITNKDLFTNELLRELNAESEDGSTLVHHMFDVAASRTIQAGAEGVEYAIEAAGGVSDASFTDGSHNNANNTRAF